MKKSLVTTTAVAAALGGLVTGAVITAGPAAIAQENATTTEQSQESFVEERLQRATDAIREALSGLVADDTITESQADAVASTLAAEGPFGHRHRGHGLGLAASSELSDLLGLETSELFAELAEGNTLADVAEAQGVDPDAVADVLVSEAEERLNAAAEKGFIDEAEVAEKLADIEESIDDVINGELPIRRNGHRGFGRGFGGADGAAVDDVATSSTS